MNESGETVSRKRWRLLSRALLNRSPSQTGETCGEPSSDDVSVRKFHTFGLINFTKPKQVDGSENSSQWRIATFPNSKFPDLKILLKLPEEQVSLSAVSGFNNTGNVCIWPSEEIMAHFCLQNCDIFSGKSVLELGAGMTGLASFVLACTSQARKVIVTDGDDRSSASLFEILERNCEEFPQLNLDSSLETRKLRWGFNDDCNNLKGKIDVILAADCLFFDEGRPVLLETVVELLGENGIAYIFAPSRHGTFEKFAQMAKDSQMFEGVKTVCDYDPLVSEKHNALLGLPHSQSHYDSNLHFPMLLLLEKQK